MEFHSESFTMNIDELEHERKQLIELYNAYYDNHPPFPRLDEQDPNRDKPRVSLGLPKLFVNRRAAALFGKDKFNGFSAFKFSNNGEKEILEQIWKANRMDTKILVTAKQALRLGDAFIKISFIPNATTKIVYQRINTEDIFPILDYQNIESPLGYIIQYPLPNGEWYREEITSNYTKIFIGEEKIEHKGFNKKPLTYVNFEPTEFYQHNLGFLPIIRIRNNEQDGEFWAQSLLQGLPPILDNLNEIISNVCYSIGEQADPLIWLKGVRKGEDLYRDADAVWYFESPEAALHTLQWEGTPKSVYDAFDRLVNNAYECAQFPILLAQDDKISNVSGAALKILMQDMVDAVSEARSFWEESFNELFAKTIAMIEKLDLQAKAIPLPVYEDDLQSENIEIVDVYGLTTQEQLPEVPDFTVEWGDIIPRDEQIFNTDLYNGLDAQIYSRKEVLRKKGYSEDYIKKIFKEIDEDAKSQADTCLSEDELTIARLEAARLSDLTNKNEEPEDTEPEDTEPEDTDPNNPLTSKEETADE